MWLSFLKSKTYQWLISDDLGKPTPLALRNTPQQSTQRLRVLNLELRSQRRSEFRPHWPRRTVKSSCISVLPSVNISLPEPSTPTQSADWWHSRSSRHLQVIPKHNCLPISSIASPL